MDFPSFGEAYSELYNFFYDDKDYAAEARFVLSRIQTVVGAGRALDILDLGCGTARHAIEFARHGHCVEGIDLSQRMLDVALLEIAQLPPVIAARLSVKLGDIRDAGGEQMFDAIFSLFHVVCYLLRDEDVLSAFVNVRRHARLGAAYLFDFWHGPAVLRDPPTIREKNIMTSSSRVRRVSTPEWDRANATVRVNYEIDITNLRTGKTSMQLESHSLRYFFPDQIGSWLTDSGFEVIEIAEWMTGRPPRDDCFSVYAFARAV